MTARGRVAGVVVVAALTALAPVSGQDPLAVVRQGKLATAMVVLPEGLGSGSAF